MDQDASPTAESPPQVRFSPDRLRERTDELELLISGLSMVALFALPNWLLASYYKSYAQLPITLMAAAISVMPMAIAFAYTLGCCFLLHLVVRAYWVGLIGLQTNFPNGIRWERLPGPIQRGRHRASVAPLPQAIANADRLASILYSLISLVALLLIWLGIVFTGLLLILLVIGQALHATNAVLGNAIDRLVLGLVINAVLLWLLDGVLVSRYPRLADVKALRWAVMTMATINRLVLPNRLIGPLRLTLQSNTMPRLFNVLLLAVMVAVPLFGTQYFQSQIGFDAYGTQRYIDNVDTRGGIRSQHYASMRTEQDRMRAWPVLPDRIISSQFTTLLLPYMPVRDDPIIAQRCPALPESAARPDIEVSDRTSIEARSRATARCFAKLWRVKLDGRPLDLESAEIVERADLGLRGLEVIVDLREGALGPRVIDIIWRPDPEQDQALDDYVRAAVYLRIPLVWSPEG